jgi:hypothetical protein
MFPIGEGKGAMSENRIAAVMAAMGGLIALVVLVVGAPGAPADELSDLRANNELLQQRLDQMKGATPDIASSGSSNSTVSREPAGGSFARSFLVPGTDTSVRIGGNITGTLSYRPR